MVGKDDLWIRKSSESLGGSNTGYCVPAIKRSWKETKVLVQKIFLVTDLRISVDPGTERILYKASLLIVRRRLLFLLSKVNGRIQRGFKGFVGELLA